MWIENRTAEAQPVAQSLRMLTYCILAMGIPGPISGIVLIGGWFCKIAQRFSQGAGDLFQVGKVKSSLAQLIVR